MSESLQGGGQGFGRLTSGIKQCCHLQCDDTLKGRWDNVQANNSRHLIIAARHY